MALWDVFKPVKNKVDGLNAWLAAIQAKIPLQKEQKELSVKLTKATLENLPYIADAVTAATGGNKKIAAQTKKVLKQIATYEKKQAKKAATAAKKAKAARKKVVVKIAKKVKKKKATLPELYEYADPRFDDMPEFMPDVSAQLQAKTFEEWTEKDKDWILYV